MFMEYCNEGTLWNIAQQGLTEEMTRHYTKDILIAVDTLHTSGIVHRDIKGQGAHQHSGVRVHPNTFALGFEVKVLFEMLKVRVHNAGDSMYVCSAQ